MRAVAILLGLAMLGSGLVPSLAGEAGNAAPSKGVELHDAWMREAVADQPASAYVTIENKGAEADKLLFVTGPAVNYVDIEQGAKGDDEDTDNAPLDSLDIPAGATVVLGPGGRTQLMVHGLEGALTRGATLFLIFHFEHAGDVSAYFTVKADDATGPGNGNDPYENHGSVVTKGA